MNALHIPNPCPADWNAMTPQNSGRHCAQCNRVVVDLTNLSPLAALERQRAFTLPFHQGERVCLRAHVGPTGRVRLRPARRRLLTVGLAAMLAMGTVGCTGDEHHLVDRLFPVPAKSNGVIDAISVNEQHEATLAPTLSSIEHLFAPLNEDPEVLVIQAWDDDVFNATTTMGEGIWAPSELIEIPTSNAPIPLLDPEPPMYNG